MHAQIIIVAQPSLALEVALDSLEYVRDDVRLFRATSEAGVVLLSASRTLESSSIAVVLIDASAPASGVEDLVAGLRGGRATTGLPIVLFGSKPALEAIDLPPGIRPNSYVFMVSDATANATTLARTIHYWARINRFPDPRSMSVDDGVRT